jgi:hypothetical protein
MLAAMPPRRFEDKLEVRQRVWNLKKEGSSTSEIAQMVGMSERNVRHIIRRTVAEIDVTSWLENEVAVDLARIEGLLKVWWPYATDVPQNGDRPDLEAAFFLVKLLERKARLLGLDAPKRVDVRALIVQWAEDHGLDPDDVIDATADLLPRPSS